MYFKILWHGLSVIRLYGGMQSWQVRSAAAAAAAKLQTAYRSKGVYSAARILDHRVRKLVAVNAGRSAISS